MLTKTQLENYSHLAGEIGDIEKQLARLEGRATFTYGADTIFDYRRGYPMPQLVAGVGYTAATHKRRQELIGKLSVQKAKLIKQNVHIEEELEKIEEVIIRRIIRLRYFEHLNWDAIAVKIDSTKTGTAMRMRLERYLENN